MRSVPKAASVVGGANEVGSGMEGVDARRRSLSHRLSRMQPRQLHVQGEMGRCGRMRDARPTAYHPVPTLTLGAPRRGQRTAGRAARALP
eukprot:351001-Chlamydomonas_euryale.AAC.1